MDPKFDSPYLTQNALGSLGSSEAALLRMSFSSPEDQATLQEQTQEIQAVAALLRQSYATSQGQYCLTEAQREKLLYFANQPDLVPEASRPEKRYKPVGGKNFALWLTLGAAAIIVGMLVFIKVPTKEVPVTSNPGSIDPNLNPDGSQPAKFHIRQPKLVEKSNSSQDVVDKRPALPEIKQPDKPLLPEVILPNKEFVKEPEKIPVPTLDGQFQAPRGPAPLPGANPPPKSFALPK
jgi:hypothetical protein